MAKHFITTIVEIDLCISKGFMEEYFKHIETIVSRIGM